MSRTFIQIGVVLHGKCINYRLCGIIVFAPFYHTLLLSVKCRVVSDRRGEERGLMGMIIIVRYKENTVYNNIIPPEVFLNKESPMIILPIDLITEI